MAATIESAELCELVVSVAREEILPRFPIQGYAIKPDGSVVTDADFAVERRLRAELQARWPEVAFLGEEMTQADQEAVLRKGGSFWVVDPVDGTSNFVARIPFFGVSLALVEGATPLVGVVYDPIRQECFRADRGRGAWFNELPLVAPTTAVPMSRATALIEVKHIGRELRRRFAGHTPFGSQRCFGSSALEWGWIALGRGHLYLHGGQRLWDLAAGWLILEEAGGYSRTLQGERVYEPTLQPRSVVASYDHTLFSQWLDWLQGL